MSQHDLKSTIQMAPSLLSADFVNLERDIRLIENATTLSSSSAPLSPPSSSSAPTASPPSLEAAATSKPATSKPYQPPEWLHVDVMDGHFVPNLTIGPPIVRAIKRITNTPLDVHLMIDNPDEQLDWFIDAGADLITVHIECAGEGFDDAKRCDEEGDHQRRMPNDGKTVVPGQSRSIQRVENPAYLRALLARIHAAGRLAGLSLNPGTPAELLTPFLSELDVVLVMSVHPGFGGQSFRMDSVEKVATIAAAIRATAPLQAPSVPPSAPATPAAPAPPATPSAPATLAALRAKLLPIIEVDGGINAQTAPLVGAAGAQMLVAGNAVFAAPDPRVALQQIRDSL